MVTFSPQPRYNPPHLNDLASRSNEYLTSKRFFLTISLLCAIEGREHRAPDRSVPRSPTLSYRTPLPRLLPGVSHCPLLTFLALPNRPISFITTLLQTLCRRKINQLLCFQSIPHSCCKTPGVGVSLPAGTDRAHP